MEDKKLPPRRLKGIILAGGKATRLYPITKVVGKQLLPVYNKPIIYYPLSILMLAGITNILIISTPKDTPQFRELLGDGRDLGLKLSFAVQDKPMGIAHALIIAKDFINKDRVCLILGDNIFYGDRLPSMLQEISAQEDGAFVFGYYVKDPHGYGVIEFDNDLNVLSIEEKPKVPKSNWIVTGLYFYDSQAVEFAEKLQPSLRGELEITDVNNLYLKRKQLKVKLLGRGYAWFDTGTHDSLLAASVYVKTIEERQGLKIGCIEEVAYRMGYIDKNQLQTLAARLGGDFREYLTRLVEKGTFGI